MCIYAFHCSGCSASCDKDEFACSPYEADSQCLSDSAKVCNNVNDCDNGADEENCAALAPTKLPMDPDSPKSLHVSGILHWKVNGRFHPLSLHLKDQVSEKECIP